VRTAVRNLKAQIQLLESSTQRDQIPAVIVELNDANDQDDEIRYLVEVIKAKQSNLRMTSSDIRLLYSVVEQQLKLGEIQPGRHNESRMSSSQQVQMPPVETAEAPPIAPESNHPQVDSQSPIQTDSPHSEDVLSIEKFLGE